MTEGVLDRRPIGSMIEEEHPEGFYFYIFT